MSEYEYLRAEEVQRLLEVLPRLSPRDELALRLCLYTGIRGCEVVTLTRGDVEEAQGTINLRRHQIRMGNGELTRTGPNGQPIYSDRKMVAVLWDRRGLTGKRVTAKPENLHAAVEQAMDRTTFYGILRGLKTSETGRAVAVRDPETLRQLREWVGSFASSDFIFPSRVGGPIGQQALYDKVKRAYKMADITRSGKGLGLHILRHTFAVNYLKKGGNLDMLRRSLGHTDIRTTAIYTRFVAEDLAEGLDRLGPLYGEAEDAAESSDDLRLLVAALAKRMGVK